jgi:hypothetical protein
MDLNQKEILERVLLMMKYDSSKTMNENKKEIRVINEQLVAAPNPDWDGTYVNLPTSYYKKIPFFYYENKIKKRENLRTAPLPLPTIESVMHCKTNNRYGFAASIKGDGPVDMTVEDFKKKCKDAKSLFNSYYVDFANTDYPSVAFDYNGVPIDPNAYSYSVSSSYITPWKYIQPTKEYEKKYKNLKNISDENRGLDKPINNMSLQELSDYIGVSFTENNAGLILKSNTKNAIILFAKKIKNLSTQELINLSYKYPCLFVESNFKSDSISSGSKNLKDKIMSKGAQAMIIDFELYRRYDLEYTQNPEKFDYQPIRYPNWDNLINYYGFSFLKDFKGSADKVVERFERGVKGKTEEGYPDYGSRYLNMQGALADMGYMKHYQLMNKITATFQNALEDYNKKNGTSYKVPLECGMSQQEISKREKYNETWSYNNPIQKCDSLLSELRKKAYPEIKNYSQIETSKKESEEEAKKFLEERNKKEFINIDIDKRTWGYPNEDVKGQNVRLGPALTFMDETQVSKIVGYLLKNCVGQSYPQGNRISVDQYQIPYCLRYDLIKEEENNDTEESEISIFKAIVKLAGIQKEQIRIMQTTYPDKPYLWQDYFQGEPGTYEYYKKNYYVYNAVRQHLIQDGNPNPTEKDVFEKIKYFTYDCIGSRDILNSIAKGNWFYNGQRVGEYYANNKGYTKYKIPCTNKTWDKYGTIIQLGGMMLVAAATWGLGVGPAMAFWINILADSALNAVSLKYSIEEQDPSKIKMDIAFLLLPFLFELGPVTKLFQSMGKVNINQEALNSVISKFTSLGNNFTPQQVEALVKSMSSDEKFVVNVMMDGTNPQVQKYVTQISDGLKASVKSSAATKVILKSLKPVAFQLVIYLVPAATYFGKKIGLIKEKWKLITGKEINEKELKILQLFYSSLSAEDALKVDKTLNENPQAIVTFVQSSQGQELYKGVTGISQMTPEEQNESLNNLKEQHKKTIDRLRMMKEQYNQNVKPENQISTSSDSTNYQNTNFNDVMSWLDEDKKVVIDNLQK